MAEDAAEDFDNGVFFKAYITDGLVAQETEQVKKLVEKLIAEAFEPFGEVLHCHIHEQDPPEWPYVEVAFKKKDEAAVAHEILRAGEILVEGLSLVTEDQILAVMDADRPKMDYSEPEPEDQVESGEEVPQESQDEIKKNRKRLACGLCCRTVVAYAVVLSAIAVGTVLRQPGLETDFDSFMAADVEAAVVQEAFAAAYAERRDFDRRLQGGFVGTRFDVVVMYDLAQEGPSTLLDHKVISALQTFEQGLTSGPLWKAMCDSTSPARVRPLCDSGVSLLHYVSPKLGGYRNGSDHPTELEFGTRSEIKRNLPIESSLEIVQRAGIESLLFPKSFDVSAPGEPLTSLRTIFRFELVCCTANGATPAFQNSWLAEQRDAWSTLMTDEVLPFFQNFEEFLEGEGVAGVRVAFDGDSIHSMQVVDVIQSDLKMAAASLTFVLIYLVCHTGSITLAFFGIVSVTLAVPLAYVAYAFITGTTQMNVASFLALFLTLGLGADVVFVYTDFWLESQDCCKSDRERLSWTYWHAAKATLATTVATSLSFLANIASVLKELRAFGLFMGLCVVLVWALVPLLYMPICAIHSWYSSKFSLCSSMFGRRRKSKEAQKSWSERATDILYLYRGCFLFIPLALGILMMTIAFLRVRLTSAKLQLLPESHMLTRKAAVASLFDDYGQHKLMPPRMSSTVCSVEEVPVPKSNSRCELNWCEVTDNWPGVDRGQCFCMRQYVFDKSYCEGDNGITVYQLYHGMSMPQDAADKSAWRQSIADYIVNTSQNLSVSPESVVPDMLVSLPSSDVDKHIELSMGSNDLVVHNWLSGDYVSKTSLDVIAKVNVDRTYFLGTLTTASKIDGQPICGWKDVCSCAASSVCAVGSDYAWQPASFPLDEITLTSPGVSRRLQQWVVPASRRSYINVAMGLQLSDDDRPAFGTAEKSALWSFSPDYEARNPWAQRQAYSLCTDIPSELRVVEKECWIEQFKYHVEQAGMRFPLQPAEFDSYIFSFAERKIKKAGTQGLYKTAHSYLWLNEDRILKADSYLKAHYVSFWVDFDRYTDVDGTMAYKAKWDAYVNKFVAQGLFSWTGLLHTSSNWVSADLQSELAASVAFTILMVICLAFVAVVLFTRSFVLSLYVVLATILIMSGLMFLIVVVLDSDLGPIEIIALIVFIGYSVTFSLHVAHLYGDDQVIRDHRDSGQKNSRSQSTPSGGSFSTRETEGLDDQSTRKLRVQFALRSIGGATIGSGLTTIGCSVPLLFCQLSIFWKLGIVAITVTVLSLAVSLLFLPSLLMLLGPSQPGCPRRFEGLPPPRLPSVMRRMRTWRTGDSDGSADSRGFQTKWRLPDVALEAAIPDPISPSLKSVTMERELSAFSKLPALVTL